ncbi:MAG: ATP-dependent 6-phosphofructokinase [Opitutae bacterium]|nr:ATP-dependent 6-phosphofructokinase [Opitutae bacterium]
MKRTKRIGILTAGGDSPGLNAAIRAVGKAAAVEHGWELIGFRDGFLGLAENRWTRLDRQTLAGILTVGGTVLGTSRDKPHRMRIGGRERDMTDTIVANYRKQRLDALVCLGGGGTQKNALRLLDAGLNILTLPKTIDNDVAHTDATIGFDTALGIATEAIDRLHSTAHSHHRIIIAEIMGHAAGWLALGAGIAGGADVILIPEIPYDVGAVAAAIRSRVRRGNNFSIVAVAEGAKSIEDARLFADVDKRKKSARTKEEKDYARLRLTEFESKHAGNTLRLAEQLKELTQLEARVTILGYVQRGGTPSFADRLLATRLGTACVDYIAEGVGGVMIAASGDGVKPVPLRDVAGVLKLVPTDHSWVTAARRVGTAMGD